MNGRRVARGAGQPRIREDAAAPIGRRRSRGSPPVSAIAPGIDPPAASIANAALFDGEKTEVGPERRQADQSAADRVAPTPRRERRCENYQGRDDELDRKQDIGSPRTEGPPMSGGHCAASVLAQSRAGSGEREHVIAHARSYAPLASSRDEGRERMGRLQRPYERCGLRDCLQPIRRRAHGPYRPRRRRAQAQRSNPVHVADDAALLQGGEGGRRARRLLPSSGARRQAHAGLARHDRNAERREHRRVGAIVDFGGRARSASLRRSHGVSRLLRRSTRSPRSMPGCRTRRRLGPASR